MHKVYIVMCSMDCGEHREIAGVFADKSDANDCEERLSKREKSENHNEREFYVVGPFCVL